MFRITPGTLIIGLLAVLFGLVGALEVRRRLNGPTSVTATGPSEPGTTLIPIATVDLDPDRTLTGSDVGIETLTAEQRKEKLLRRQLPPVFISTSNQIIGRTLRRRVLKGSVFQPEDFYPDNLGPVLADRLRDTGTVGVSVAVESVGMLAGNAVPGARVDVIFRTAQPLRTDLPLQTVNLLSNVEVLAVGNNSVVGSKTGFTADRPNIVTLAVPTEKARRLKTAEGRGILSLVLRDPSDVSMADEGEVPETLEALFNLPPAKGPWVAEIYRRGSRQTVVFDRGLVDKELFGRPLDVPPPGGLPRITPPPVNPVPPPPNNGPSEPGETSE